jgi:pimeloyl-ACP methyl ester carboxylesterase
MYLHTYYHQPVFVFLHAFPLHGGMWKSQQEYLMQNHINSVAVDYPGFGKTPVMGTDISMKDLSKAVMESLARQNIHQMILVGCSMGGYLAFQLYRDYPEKIVGMVLSNTRATADTEEARDRRLQFIDQIRTTQDIEFIKKMHMYKFFSRKTAEQQPDVIRQVDQWMQEITHEGVISALHAMAYRLDSTDLLSSITFPVLIIHGEEDPFIPPDDYKIMVQNIPKAEVHIFKNCAHLCNLENSMQFNSLLKEYYRRLHS